MSASGERIAVLDHGYVQFVEHWGSDERVIEAARMSTDKGFKGWDSLHSDVCQAGLAGRPTTEVGCTVAGVDCCKPVPGDEKLLAYLWKNDHHTPFEMAGAQIIVQAPIAVFREWHRHRTQSYNEMSARYTPLPDVNYVPTRERFLRRSKENKQAGTIAGAAELTPDVASIVCDRFRDRYAYMETWYQEYLKMGVPKELARLQLPVGRYSRMMAQATLRNWLAFLTLRMAPNAQWEIVQFADVVHDILAVRFPRTLALFNESFSAKHKVVFEAGGLTK